MALLEELLELIRTDPEAREAVRRNLFTPELLAMPATMGALAAAQQRTDQRLEELTLHLDRLAEQVDRVAAAQENMLAEIRGESEWRRGEQGRREGERYGRDTVRHSDAIFGGGRGALERPEDLEQLRRTLASAFAADLSETDNPFLADALWRKGDRIAVLEVSHRVDRYDVERADRRAATLRKAGISAVAVVIGKDWASEEAEESAVGRSVEWRVGGAASSGYLDFRRAPSG